MVFTTEQIWPPQLQPPALDGGNPRHLRQTNTPPPGRLWPRRQPWGTCQQLAARFGGHKITNPNNAVVFNPGNPSKLL